MNMYQHVAELWEQPKENLGPLWKERLIAWRREPVTNRLERPTRIDRARSLGYKAKNGLFVVRQRVSKGPHRRTWAGGRRSKAMRTIKALRKSYQVIAEERANKVFHNCEVLNSYWVAQDGRYYWYEVLLVDPEHPEIKADKQLGKFTGRGRAYRGMTSAGKKMRGLRWKGKGAEKARPSRRANLRRL
ncbi:MAG: 50S ribosomal protein L15e [Candidatus Woesearchaeota archaeon]|nr:50S ribosomal protein L15e [Candidatus Woesearchaeota archaeon]